MSEPRWVRFGTFEFDFSTRELRSSGRRVPLQSQPAQVLALLLSRSGQIVTREELRAAIWNDDTFVEFDTALNVAVNKIRQSLRDSASAPRFVETIPRHGYRFLADVHPIVAAPAPPVAVPTVPPAIASAVPPARRRVAPVWISLAVVLVSVTAAAIWSVAGVSESSAPIRSVAVLPFRPLVAGSGDEVLEVGLAEAVIIRLGQLKQLRVPSIHAVQRFARQQPDPRAAGRDLGVESVLEGSLLRVNGNLRFSARLVDVATGTTLWAQQWDLPWSDILTVQDTLALEVSRALAVRLSNEGPALPEHPTNVAAYERYLRARYLLLRRTVADSQRAAELLEEATALDTTSAAAHASLGFAYLSVAFAGPRDPFVEKARAATRRALELDPAIAEAHAVLGRIMLHFDLDVEEGHREMRRAFELNPANPFVLHCYSQVLADDGRFDEALQVADRALAQEPTSVLATRDKALILLLAGRYEESVAMSRRTLELDPYTPEVHGYLGRAYEQLGREQEAVEAYVTPLTFSEGNRDVVAALRAAAARDGLRGYWQQRLQSLLKEPRLRTYSIASAYARLGDHDRALAWLDRHFAERGPSIRGLKVQPQWDQLRGDPRFQELLRRARFDPVPSTGS